MSKYNTEHQHAQPAGPGQDSFTQLHLLSAVPSSCPRRMCLSSTPTSQAPPHSWCSTLSLLAMPNALPSSPLLSACSLRSSVGTAGTEGAVISAELPMLRSLSALAMADRGLVSCCAFPRLDFPAHPFSSISSCLGPSEVPHSFWSRVFVPSQGGSLPR